MTEIFSFRAEWRNDIINSLQARSRKMFLLRYQRGESGLSILPLEVWGDLRVEDWGYRGPSVKLFFLFFLFSSFLLFFFLPV